MCIYNSYFIYCSVNIFKLNVLHSHVRCPVISVSMELNSKQDTIFEGSELIFFAQGRGSVMLENVLALTCFLYDYFTLQVT